MRSRMSLGNGATPREFSAKVIDGSGGPIQPSSSALAPNKPDPALPVAKVLGAAQSCFARIARQPMGQGSRRVTVLTLSIERSNDITLRTPVASA